MTERQARRHWIPPARPRNEAITAGADAVLLIARALEPGRLSELAADAVIGVNDRDLETLELDDAVGGRLLPLVPADRPAEYESGVWPVGVFGRQSAKAIVRVADEVALDVVQLHDGASAHALLSWRRRVAGSSRMSWMCRPGWRSLRGSRTQD